MNFPDFLPYGRQTLDARDLEAVQAVLTSDWLTTGPKVDEFEALLADHAGADHAVAVSSGTAALHCAMHALGIGPGDEVIVPTLTFAATANAVVYQGATPVFADVAPATLLIDPASVEKNITPRTRAVIAMDYAGQPCDYARLRAITDRHGLSLVADACHSLGARYKGRPAGSLADLNIFSFHPVKHIATGEGGMVLTDDDNFARAMRRFRNHGITADHRQRARQATWKYEMVELGYNYRLSDIHCALGISQYARLPLSLERRRAIAHLYDEAFADVGGLAPLSTSEQVEHAYHLYVVRIKDHRRDEIFDGLRAARIGAAVHYPPAHLHPFYRERFATGEGICPVAETAADEILTLPLFPAMSDADARRVIRTVISLLEQPAMEYAHG